MAFAQKTWSGRAPALLLFLGPAMLFVAIRRCDAQTLPQTSPDTVAALQTMTRLAGVIFAGRVINVRHCNRGDGVVGAVAIEFVVEDAVRGTAGSTYTLREWARLWSGSDEPFRVGHRYLMLLHAPGAAGLSSPVGGTDGAIPIRGEIGPPQADGRTVDLRWVATTVTRPITYRATERPTGLPNAMHPEVATPNAAIAEDASGSNSNPTTQRAPYGEVLAALRSWQKDEDAAR